ncbi:MAG TPA: LLM class flavin-dependent oxidoreductase [Thermoanaerobaculia bacterium]|jgi:alkanesulfonate monooxygenase
MSDASLRFHWMLPKGGEVVPGVRQTPQEACRYRVQSTARDSVAPLPDIRGWSHFARAAEEAGIDSVLISFSRYEPDPIAVSAAMSQVTERLRYMLAYRSGFMQPATFVQQINTISALSGGRVSINMVAGSSAAEQRGYGDFLSHDERYARAAEFLTVCRAFWTAEGEVDFDGRYFRVEKGKLHTRFVASSSPAPEPRALSPEIYISGHSEEAERLAMTHGTSWLRVVDTPEKVAPHAARARANGVGVCLRLCIICRPTREEAVAVMDGLLADDIARRRDAATDETQLRTTALKNDSRMHAEALTATADGTQWLNRTIFTGFVPLYGPVWTTLIGTPRELADAFLAYREAGVTEFILSGWPEAAEVEIFGREVLPLVRVGERHLAMAG